MTKKLSGLLFLLSLLAVGVLVLCRGGYGPLRHAFMAKTDQAEKVEQAVSQQIPNLDFLRRMRVMLSYIGGNKEQNGVFIGDNTLMLDVQPAGQKIIDNNITSVIELSQRFERPSFLMLIPTACAIQQSKVPYNSVAPLYDQKSLIDEVYRRMAGNVTVINVYPTLFNHQKEYLYYRTSNAPTGLGGYYIYSVAASKLGQAKPRGIEQFDVEHIDHSYYGDLYNISPYRAVEPDRVSIYLFSGWQRSYIMNHYDKSGQVKRYYTIYPRYKEEISGSMEVILGGVSPVVDIEVSNSQYNKRLLVLGDKSMQSYLPFLLIHYNRITFVDTANVSPDLLSRIDPESYNQVLFAYSVDKFVGEDVLSAMSRFAAPVSVQKTTKKAT